MHLCYKIVNLLIVNLLTAIQVQTLNGLMEINSFVCQ
jgi:hypothetical protein